MRIVSLNVNNFGGLVSKPLIKDYKYRGATDWDMWKKAVIEWRRNIEWENNVDSIVNHVRNFDLVVLQEVDTNTEAFEKLIQLLGAYTVVYPNQTTSNDFAKGSKSITLMFIKKHYNYTIVAHNFSTKKMKNVEVIIGDKHIIGLHITMGDINYWDSLIKHYKGLKEKKVLVIGDMNVHDQGTKHKEKFIKLLNCGALDAWVEEGNSMDRPTANTGRRIDYAIMSPLCYEELSDIAIGDTLRNRAVTDHSAIVVSI